MKVGPIAKIIESNNIPFLIATISCRSVVGSVLGLLDVKSAFEPQARCQNKIQKIFPRLLPLRRFLAKTLIVNKIAMKSFLKKSVVRSRL